MSTPSSRHDILKVDATTSGSAGSVREDARASATQAARPAAVVPVPRRLAMPKQDLSRPSLRRAPVGTSTWLTRAALFGGALVLTTAFATDLHAVMSPAGRLTGLQWLFLAFSTLAFGWIALGSLSAAIGFFTRWQGGHGDTLTLSALPCQITTRTALLFPAYHEDPEALARTVEAVAGELEQLGAAKRFDVFVLSDSRDEEAVKQEARVFHRLRASLRHRLSVYFRRRPLNTAKKAGNIEDWVMTHGGGYDHFVIFDGDSIMSGETLVRLTATMQANPLAGLIQTVPRLTGGRTLFQRLQQFAAATYGPAIATGMALWSGRDGNYWGHNAIIRTRAFASTCGLPTLAGAAPFGGAIQSHDFVEAALLQRAGWEVHMVPSLQGSYEGAPPTVIDLTVRDRRWAQGNLQHLNVLRRRGLTAMGRVHLTMGVTAYLVSMVWAASLLAGLVLALQGQQILPNYFAAERSLFPIWPVFDSGGAVRLFVATLGIVLLPKVFGLLLALRDEARAMQAAGARLGTRLAAYMRVAGGVVLETLLSVLLAPIFMVTQSVAIVQILRGRDSGWAAQRRDDAAALRWRDGLRFHVRHVLLGLVVGALAWLAAPAMLGWMAPIVAGLVLAPALSVLTAKVAPSACAHVLATAEDRASPSILRRLRALEAAPPPRDRAMTAHNDTQHQVKREAA
ncbi:MAG: glucans biosynthesis glucosyltransferase MdoH [Pseudomonadota bacterium]